jgi:hypothetical protein
MLKGQEIKAALPARTLVIKAACDPGDHLALAVRAQVEVVKPQMKFFGKKVSM